MSDYEIGNGPLRLLYAAFGLVQLAAGLGKLLFLLLVGVWGTFRPRRSTVRGS